MASIKRKKRVKKIFPRVRFAGINEFFANRSWRWLYFLSVFVGFFLLAIWYTRPLIFHFSSQIIGQFDFTDGPFFLWNIWWVEKALHAIQNPFFSSFVYYPANANLSLHTLTFTTGLLSLPISWFLGLVGSLNLILLLSFAATAVGMTYLIYDMTKNRFAGVISGLIFAFSPYMFGHLWAGHYNLTMLWPIPLVVLFFNRTLKDEKLIDAILCSVFLLAVSYLDLQLTAFTLVILLFIFIFRLIFNARSLTLKKILHLAIIVVSFLVLFALPYFNWTGQFPKIDEGTYNNGDFSMIFGFNPLNPYLSAQSKFIFLKNLVGSYRENSMSLSFAALLAAAGSFVFFNKHVREKLSYLVILGVGIILALGPNWQKFGIIYDNIRLPFYYVAKLPFFNMGVVPTRFIVVAYFALAVLAGLFCADLMATAKNKWSKVLTVFIVAVFCLLVGFENFSGQMLMTEITTSPILNKINQDPNDVNVIGVNPNAMDGWWQTIHGKKVVGGYLGRRVHGYYMSQYFEDPGVAYLLGLRYGPPEDLDKDRDEAMKSFEKYKIGYVIVQKKNLNKDQLKEVQQYFDEIGIKIWQEDDFVLGYKIQ